MKFIITANVTKNKNQFTYNLSDRKIRQNDERILGHFSIKFDSIDGF